MFIRQPISIGSLLLDTNNYRIGKQTSQKAARDAIIADLYQNFYKHDDHVAVANLVMEKVKIPWMVSYDNRPEIVGMYRGCRTITYDLSHSANLNHTGSEVMFFSPDLIIPKVESPRSLIAVQ